MLTVKTHEEYTDNKGQVVISTVEVDSYSYIVFFSSVTVSIIYIMQYILSIYF